MNVQRPFDSWKYAKQSLQHYWRLNLAVMVGIVAGTAVLTGALVVGDSVRDSLRRLIIERLGRVDEILVSRHFFSAELLDRLRSDPAALSEFPDSVPAILFPSTSLEHVTGERRYRSPQATVVGTDDTFWDLGVSNVRPERLPRGRQIVLNEPLAEHLNASIGDRIVVRLAKESRIAADSTLADKSDLNRSLTELEVVAIVPAKGLGRFSLNSNQATPHTAFLPLDTLQQALDQAGQLNAILFGDNDARSAPNSLSVERLRDGIHLTLEDAGLNLKHVRLTFYNEATNTDQSVLEYLSLSTDSMVFSDEADATIRKALAGLEFQPVITYLANSITKAGSADTGIPYSTVTAIDSNSTLGPLVAEDGTEIGPLADNEIVLNSWAAEDLDVNVGDQITMTYFDPETTHGQPEELANTFTLKAVVPIRQPLLPFDRDTPARYVSPPTFANDPDLTPEVPGVTDQASIDDWDPPFPFEYGRIRNPTDEDYWDNYRTTPKAFVSESTGRSMWQSRFGETTSFRIALTEDVEQEALRQKLAAVVSDNLEDFGFSLLHVKADGLSAAKGTTPFNLLFIGFSLFIIAAALMLVALLARLSIEQRSANAGLLLAVGLPRRAVIRLFVIESLLLSVIGAMAGGLLGIGYADLMLVGLKTWWVEAIVTPFLQLSVFPITVIIGVTCGILAASLTIVWTIFSLRRMPVRDLLAGEFTEPTEESSRPRRRRRLLPVVLLIFAVALSVAATFLGGEAQAGAFFGSGAAVLLAMLILTAQQLRLVTRQTREISRWSFVPFVYRNVARNANRSTLTIGLMAAACFLIVAISAFRLAPTTEGTGGFDLIAQSDWPIFENLNDSDIRLDLFGRDHEQLAGVSIFPLRMKQGDDASCRNLYQAQRPRLIGFTQTVIRHFDADGATPFAWSAHAAETDEERSNPWQLLRRDREGAVPVVIDKNTAMYSLHLYKGVGEQFELDYGAAGTVRFEVVGLLANSILQGSLIVSDENLLPTFPGVSGYHFFLIDCPSDQCAASANLLEERFSDQGLFTIDTTELLRDLLAVQNTYLSTFQSLGGLGLLLGTFGLAAVQLRNVFERRRELALLRATGYGVTRIANFVLAEHLILLFSGLSIGLIAALITVLPHTWSGGARPPWTTLTVVLATILFVGTSTGAWAVSRAVRAPVVQTLRDE